MACIWALAATAAVAQPTAPPHTSALQALFAQAWRLQPEAQALALRRQAAQAQRDGADAWTAEPAALELQTKTDRPGSRLGNREHTVGVALPLWLPGERARRAALGDAELQAVHSSSQAAQLALAARVREAWWLWQRTCGDLALAQDQMDSAQSLEADVARRFAVGDMARADLYQAQAGVAQAQAAAAQAQGACDAARAALSVWGGAQDLHATGQALAAEPEPALDQPLSVPPAHPALAEGERLAAVARRQAELVAVQTRANPELTLSAASARGQAGESYQQSVTVGVRLPLGAGVRAQAREATALAQALEADTRVQRERERLAADLRAAAAQARAAAAQQQAMARNAELARATRGFVAKAFALGEADWPTRLRVEQDAVLAERQWLRARIDAAAAVSTLRQALGLLPQ
ncbi:TolC family protein [Alicycliphilus denitrificans]|uniref:TolC family protein n=1 Tax=Alicycliphilus denitrificans TaxID=179636 RepID=UPI00384DD271